MRLRIYAEHMKWSEYASRLVGSRNQADVAYLAGVSQGTVSRWVNGTGGQPNAQKAIDFARACDGNPIEVLVVLGIIEPGELDQVVEVGASADDLSNGQLVELLARRLGVSIGTRGVKGA